MLEFAGTSNYGFAVPRGEFAFIPTRSVLPKIFAWGGFTEQHWFDFTEFSGTPDDPDIGYRLASPRARRARSTACFARVSSRPRTCRSLAVNSLTLWVSRIYCAK